MHGHHYRRSAKNVHAMCVVDLLRNLDDQNINEVDCCLAKVMMGIDGCFILMFPPRLQQPVVLPSCLVWERRSSSSQCLVISPPGRTLPPQW